MPVLEQPSDVLRQFCHGDLEAFETLFRLHQSEVYGWIVRIVRDRAAAEDLTIETFWRIHRAHARFDPGRSFGAWARRIATNAALDYLKSARSETRHSGRVGVTGVAGSGHLRGSAAEDGVSRSSGCRRSCGSWLRWH